MMNGQSSDKLKAHSSSRPDNSLYTNNLKLGAVQTLSTRITVRQVQKDDENLLTDKDLIYAIFCTLGCVGLVLKMHDIFLEDSVDSIL